MSNFSSSLRQSMFRKMDSYSLSRVANTVYYFLFFLLLSLLCLSRASLEHALLIHYWVAQSTNILSLHFKSFIVSFLHAHFSVPFLMSLPFLLNTNLYYFLFQNRQCFPFTFAVAFLSHLIASSWNSFKADIRNPLSTVFLFVFFFYLSNKVTLNWKACE